jgi:GTP-binding protein EngB required for normal cell division
VEREPEPPKPERLKLYVRLKQAVARHVRAVAHDLDVAGVAEQAAACHDLMAKLAEDRFTLAVVGQFKRGKSSLMNALIGADVLPTGVLPLTSAITVLRFGPKVRLIVDRQGWTLKAEAPLSDLSGLVTERGNPGNEKRIKAVYVEHPSTFLRRGLEFVDTPGIGSAIEANTATTYSFVPNCDAVLFVTATDGPLAVAEREFLDRIRQHVRKVFFVVNKMDLLEGQARDEVLQFVGDELARFLNVQAVRVFPVSSRQALTAQPALDDVSLAESGLPALEAALAEFLANQRVATLLITILERAENLLAFLPVASAEKRRAASRTLRERILESEDETIAVSVPILPPPGRPVAAEGTRSLELPSGVIGLEPSRTCPICRNLDRAVFDFLARWQYLLSTDEAAQTAFAEEGGFCPPHTWQLAALSSPQGLSAGYLLLLERVSGRFRELARSGRFERLPEISGQAATCRVCRVLADGEIGQVRELARELVAPAGRAAYSRSGGTCARHLSLLLAAVPDDGTRRVLLEEASRRLDDLVEDMQSFVIKQEGRRRDLQNRDEADAYLRALVQLVGQKGLSSPG